MVTGALRLVLWILGSLGVLWLLAGIASLPAMWQMMGEQGLMGGPMMQDGATGGGMMPMMGGGMMAMMLAMVAQFLAMVGLVGVFIYLVVDSLRHRSAGRASS